MSFMQPLLALQELDARIRELQQEIRDIPSRRSQEESRIQESQERVSAAQAELRAVQTRVADFELQAQAVRDRIVKLKQQQMTLKTNKEFKAMEIEISAAQREADSFEGEQITAMDAVTPVKARLKVCEARLAEERAGIAGYLEELDRRLAEAGAALQQVEGERAECVKLVNAQQVRVYDRLRTSRWPAIVRLENGVCGGCHMAQSPSIAHLVRRNNALVSCQMCGRLLHA